VIVVNALMGMEVMLIAANMMMGGAKTSIIRGIRTVTWGEIKDTMITPVRGMIDNALKFKIFKKSDRSLLYQTKITAIIIINKYKTNNLRSINNHDIVFFTPSKVTGLGQYWPITDLLYKK